MLLESIEIPYGCYWSTPFARWQGSFANLPSLEFAAYITGQELAAREIDPEMIDYGVLGMTRPERGSFYGLPYFAGLAGVGHIAGPTVSQACATSVRALLAASQELGSGMANCALAVACDRTSNGPHIYYPNPQGAGGYGESEDFIMDNMSCDPLGGHSMVQTAENVAAKYQISTSQQHDVVLRREQQYAEALSDEAGFQRRYMTLPFKVPHPRFYKSVAELGGDEGVNRSTAEGLAELKPVVEGGTVTYGAQTYPADGNAGIVVTSTDLARELARDKSVRIRVRGFGLSRAALAFMPEAPIEAAQRALNNADVKVDAIDAVKTHNPFAVNDLVLAKAMGLDVNEMNNFGCSLVYGHPNGPTGLRGIIELIEELVLRGGGVGLFTGCAAGDTAMAVVLRVDA
jgi:acetyl-CoA acetyltransferase